MGSNPIFFHQTTAFGDESGLCGKAGSDLRHSQARSVQELEGTHTAKLMGNCRKRKKGLVLSISGYAIQAAGPGN